MPSFISIDKLTHEVIALKAESVFIPAEVKGVKLTENEKNDLREGKAVYLEGMLSEKGREFNAHIQVNAERRGVEFIFTNSNNHLNTSIMQKSFFLKIALTAIALTLTVFCLCYLQKTGVQPLAAAFVLVFCWGLSALFSA